MKPDTFKPSWWWIFRHVLIGASNPAGAKHWTRVRLQQNGWIRAEQLCPRRVEGPFMANDYADWCQRRQWGVVWTRGFAWWLHNGTRYRILQVISRWFHARRHYRLGRFFNVYGGGTRWEWPWQPRTCSYCGGVHPADAIKLISEGWGVDGTTKSYKRYLEPPRRDWHPVPPVKLYTPHFSEQDINEFNAKLRAQIRPVERSVGLHGRSVE